MKVGISGRFGLGAAMVLFAASSCYGVIQVGSSRDEVTRELGAPEFEYTRGGTEILSYVGMEIELQDGVVMRLPRNLSARIERGTSRRQEQLKQDAIIIRSRAVAARAAKPRASGASAVRVVSNGGKNISLKSYMKPGKVTVIDFYADWCGPCRQISPALERLANGDPNVNLVKVDIVKWGTPVTKQFNIQSIPYVRVFNARGRPIGAPTHQLPQIVKNIAAAR